MHGRNREGRGKVATSNFTISLGTLNYKTNEVGKGRPVKNEEPQLSASSSPHRKEKIKADRSTIKIRMQSIVFHDAKKLG